MNTAIKVNHLTKIYKLYDKPIDRLKESLHPLKKQYHKDFYALNNVNFEIKKGETVGIIGKNGAGKSTLLKIITGVLNPTSGSVHINGRIASLLELGAGFNPEYTGMENIYFQGSLMGYRREEIKKKIDEILLFADIGDFVYQPVKAYSSGMFARLAFAIAINVDPDVFIVDEALSVGDMNFQAKCMTAMNRIKEKGTTILFVSHDIGSVKSLCQRGIYIKDGEMTAIGAASEISELYIRDMREILNKEHRKNPRDLQSSAQQDNLPETVKSNIVEFKKSEEFDRKVSQFRQSTSGAKVTFVELLDLYDEPVVEAESNQDVKLRIYFESDENISISVNYYVLDDKRNSIFGGGPRLFNNELLSATTGSKYLVEYKFKLPLGEGNYSVQVQITSPIILNYTAEFVDIIEDAVVFRMQSRPNVRIWSKVFVESTYEVKKFD